MKLIKNLIKKSLILSLIFLSILLFPITLFLWLIIKLKNILILKNHREMGIGHLLTELPFAFKILSERNVKGLIFHRNKSASKDFQKIFHKKIIFIHYIFTYLFFPFVLILESQKSCIDIGSSPRSFDILLDEVKLNNEEYQKKARKVYLKRAMFHFLSERSNFYKKTISNLNFFSNDKIKEFNEYLENKNIYLNKGNWFVCIHAREDFAEDDYRSNKFENYLQVCEFINDNGGKVIRLGKNLNPLENKNIISLENKNCNNFLLNLFLINSSKIFISTASGPSSVCNLLIKTPQIQANSIFESAPCGIQNTYMPNMILDKKKDQIIPASKYWNHYYSHHHKIHENYKVIKSSSDEITNAFKYKLNEIESKKFTNDQQFEWKKSFGKNSYYRFIKSKVDPLFYQKYFDSFFNK